MKIARRATLPLLLGLTILAWPTAAWAAGPGGGNSGSGSIGPGGITAVGSSPGGDGGGTPASDPASFTAPPPNPPPSTQSAYTWSNKGPNNQFACLDNGSTIPFASVANGQPAPAGTAVVGPNPYPNTYQLVGPNGAPVGPTQLICPNVANLPAATAPPPPPPPPPPSAAEVWAETPLPVDHIAFNPATLGLTQLPTWIWFTGPNGAIHATVTIRGYTVTTTASPVAAYWTFGDGGSAKGSVGGSEAQPSVTHTYVNIGHYTVTLIVAWSGQFTFAGHGVPAQTVALGTVDGATTAAPYAVQEVRSVGIAPASNS